VAYPPLVHMPPVLKGRDALVFTDQRRGVLRNSNWRARVFHPAVEICQAEDDEFPAITPHDLRHTAASLAGSAGANVKALQRMLGHAKASIRWTPTRICSRTTLTKWRSTFTRPSARLNLLRSHCGPRGSRPPHQLSWIKPFTWRFTCGAKGIRTPDLLDANESIWAFAAERCVG
jgi:hypothetical protein